MADESLTWEMKIGADTSGAEKMDSALGKIGEHAKGADKEFNKLGTEASAHMRNTGKHAEDLSHKIRYEFGTIGHSINYAKIELKELAEAFGLYEAIEGLKKLGETVLDVGEEILMTAAKAERFDASFKLALGEKPGEEILEYIEKVGHHTEFTQEQLKGMNLELAKSGFKGAGLARGTEAAIDLAAMSSNPQEGANSAIEALRRIQTTGRLQARALMPFGISEKQLYAELATETGLGVETVKKKLEKGTLDIDTTLNSLYTVITHKTGKALGGAGADMENLFSTRLKNLKEIPDLLYEKMSKSHGFATISEWIGKIGDQFGLAGAQGEKILGALTDEVNRFGNALGDVDAGDLGSTIGDVIHLVGRLAAGTVELIEDVASGIQRLERGYLRIKAAFGGDEEKKAYGKFILDEARADRVKEAQSAPTYKEDMDDLEEAERSGALGSGAAKGGEKAGEAAGEKIGHAIHKGTRKALGIESPSKVFAEMGRMSAIGFSDGIEDHAARVDASIARMTSAPTSIGRGAGGAGGGLNLTVAPHVVVHASPGMSAAEVGQIAAEKVVELAPGAVQSMFDQMAMQTGAAA